MAKSVLQWHVPDASQKRLEQLLAQFGYMPLVFVTKEQRAATDADSQLTAAVIPPKGHWTWRWKKTPKRAAVAVDARRAEHRSTRARS